MFCDGCGASVQPGQAFCSKCGKQIVGPVSLMPSRVPDECRGTFACSRCSGWRFRLSTPSARSFCISWRIHFSRTRANAVPPRLPTHFCAHC